jgi:PPOX class probable FMN-dependent enzyme
VSAPDLDALYAPAAPMIRQAVRDHLVDVHEAYLKAATFFCLATAKAANLDVSPRGGPPGFVHVLDRHTVAFADWPGNNRIASLRNLQADARVGMLFLFPGFDAFLRINGHADVSVDPQLLARLAENGRTPKAATVVTVNEVLFHCGKAANRAKLWEPGSHLAPGAVPSVGKVLSTLADLGGADVGQLEAHYAHAVKHDLY